MGVKFGKGNGNGNGHGKKELPSRFDELKGRIPTSVMVRVIDMSKLDDRAFQSIPSSHRRDAFACRHSYRHGIVITPKGIYALSSDGSGSLKPVTKSNPYVIDFYLEAETWSSGAPDLVMEFDENDLINLPYEGKENLAQFIRVFGPRLEYAYDQWRRLLEPKGPS